MSRGSNDSRFTNDCKGSETFARNERIHEVPAHAWSFQIQFKESVVIAHGEYRADFQRMPDGIMSFVCGS